MTKTKAEHREIIGTCRAKNKPRNVFWLRPRLASFCLVSCCRRQRLSGKAKAGETVFPEPRAMQKEMQVRMRRVSKVEVKEPAMISK